MTTHILEESMGVIKDGAGKLYRDDDITGNPACHGLFLFEIIDALKWSKNQITLWPSFHFAAVSVVQILFSTPTTSQITLKQQY